MGTAGPLRQPIPVARSILWSPAGEGPKRPGHVPFPIFLSQAALTAVHEHLAAPPRPGQGVLGFLLGDLCECPDTNLSYLVIDSAVRLNQAIYGDRTRDVVTRLWDRLEAQLEEQHAHLIGWYHTHAPLPLQITDHDVETHEQYFGEPWQTALLLGTDPDEPAAAFFRAGSDESWVSTPLPFYELLGPDSIRPDGRKRSFVTWRNYRAYNAVMPPAVTAPRPAATPHAERAPQAPPPTPPAEPKFTPAAPTPRSSSPPPTPTPRPRRPEPEDGELKFLTAAEDMPPPPPRRRATPPPRAAPPLPPEPEEEREPAADSPAPTDADQPAAPVWPDEFERGEEAEPEQQGKPARPRPARRRRRLPRVVARALVLLVIVAAAGGAYWWFQPQLSLPSWSAVRARWSALTAEVSGKISGLSGAVSALKTKFQRARSAPTPAPAKQRLPATPPPRPATVSPPAQAPARAPAAPSPVAALDVIGDSLVESVRNFADRAGMFTRGQLPCAGLARGLSAVESRWIAYNTARRRAGVLDAAHAARDQRLYAGVDSVERRFEQSACPRP